MTQPAQTIHVTGINSSFGRLIVETLARQGHAVFVAAGVKGLWLGSCYKASNVDLPSGGSAFVRECL